MTVNKDYIISKYGEKAFAKVQDFLYCENKDILSDLKYLISNENLRSFEYEGNKYIISKSFAETTILIVDGIAEENKVFQDSTRLILTIEDFLKIIT